MAHLTLKEPGEQEALRARRLHHQAVVHQARVEYKVVEDVTEVHRSRQLVSRLCRGLRVVSKHAGVVQQLLAIDAGLADILKAKHEERQGFARIDGEQFSQVLHDTPAVTSTSTRNPSSDTRN